MLDFAATLPEYELASEHEHSNCFLIAHKKVYIFFLFRSPGKNMLYASKSFKLCNLFFILFFFFLSLTQFKINNRWHTWIDYDKFHELVSTGQPFTSMDYLAPTPDWAVWGSAEQGFDPIETRHHRKAKE